MIRKMRRRRNDWLWIRVMVGGAILAGCMLWLFTLIKMIAQSAFQTPP